MDKKLIRLTESDLHRIVKQSVSKILKEGVPQPPSANDRHFETNLRDKQNGDDNDSINRNYKHFYTVSKQAMQNLDELINFFEQDLLGYTSVERNKRIQSYVYDKLDSLYALKNDLQPNSPIMQAYLNHTFNPFTYGRKDSDQYKTTSAFYKGLRKGGDTYIGPEAPYGA